MFKCFNLRADDKKSIKFRDSLKNLPEFQKMKTSVDNDIHATLADYIAASQDNKDLLDGDKMQTDYFASVPAQIFLSHSHQDEDLALSIKYYLENEFRISVFVDSCVWGYCNDLLKKIDDKYCYQYDSNTYNYNKRNNSTAIVHMMLSTALTQMMDKCECIFFLNTQQSNLHDAYGNLVQTASPWIYHELSTMKVLRKKTPLRRRKRIEKRALTEDSAYSVIHTVSLADIPEINFIDLCKWLQQKQGVISTDLLDALYEKYNVRH